MRSGARIGAWLAWPADRIAPLAALSAVLALLAPSPALAHRSDVLLAALVLFTALGIVPRRLLVLRRRPAALIALSIIPFIVLTALGWALSRPFGAPTRDGILALGLSSSEVASVGLVALAGGDAILALGVLVGSLMTSAVFGPLLVGVLGPTIGQVSTGSLLGRFALVVLVPLVVALAARVAAPTLQRAEPALDGLSALSVCALIYAALSALPGGGQLAAAALGSATFLAASSLLAIAAARLISRLDAAAVALPVGMRDFAVAAALGAQAFGPAAASIAGIYGVLMLITGALAATALKRSSST